MTHHHANALTFAKFITSRHATDTPRGDFIDDTRVLIKLGKFPTITKQSELDDFLWERGASAEAVLVGRKLWNEFKRARNRELKRLPNKGRDPEPDHLYQ